MVKVEDGSMNPRLSLALSVSDRVIITVKKIITLRRFPVNTYFQEKWRGQLITRIDVAKSPEYHECSNLQNTGGAW